MELQCGTPSRSKLNLLAVSLAYPPLAYPRSIQVARLLRFLDTSTVVVCADEPNARKDFTIEPDAADRLHACIKVPVTQSFGGTFIDRVAYRLHKPLWLRRTMAPDNYGRWRSDVLKAVDRLVHNNGYHPDVLLSFAQPFTDHLIGLELKRRLRIPWVAHFSDPWVDNPFNKYDAKTRQLNAVLERRVIEAADLLAFTSDETIRLVMKKYDDSLSRKACIVPQSFDPALFQDAPQPDVSAKITIRYIGNFYGHRTAKPLVNALSMMHSTDPGKLDNVRFELIGINDPSGIEKAGGDRLPAGLLNVYPSIDYGESLKRMSGADGLLIIDAPADVSVFLPSKLVDYIGSGRPVFGITPAGTAASLIQSLGGRVVDPSDIAAIRDALFVFIDELSKRRNSPNSPWGELKVRGRFEAGHVARSFREMLVRLVDI